MSLSIKEKEEYYKKRNRINRLVAENIKKRGHVVFGARAINAHLPSHLDRHTEDFDLYSKTPRKSARRLERKLDDRFNGNFFRVEPAKHPGTTKVVSNVTERGIADFSSPAEPVSFIKKSGTNVITLQQVKKNIHKSLRNPEAEYRRAKDREAMQRINLYERELQKKRKLKEFKKQIQKQTQVLRPAQPQSLITIPGSNITSIGSSMQSLNKRVRKTSSKRIANVLTRKSVW